MPVRPGEVEPRWKGNTVWACPSSDTSCTRETPCARCRGTNSQRGGRVAQRRARRVLERQTGAPAARFSTLASNEESWAGLPIRVEVKSGAQVGPIATRFLAAEAQSQAAKAVGDARPFVMLAVPADWGDDGLVLCRMSKLGAVVDALGGL